MFIFVLSGFMGHGMEKRYNIGIAVLKILSCFFVVYCHFGVTEQTCFSEYKCAVPIFMSLSFMLSSSEVYRGEYIVLYNRIKRLLLPFWFWGLAGACVWPITTSLEWTWCELGKRLLMQLFFGSSLNSPLYFIFVLIVLHLMLFPIAFVKRSNIRMCLYVSILLATFALEYADVNYKICNFVPFGGNNVIGRICELAPYAVIGILLKLSIERQHGQYYIIIIGLLALGIFLGLKHGLGVSYFPKGFGYQGCLLFLECVGLLCLFSGIGCILPAINSGSIISQSSRLTGGVYFSHRLSGDLIELKFPLDNGMFNAIVVFVISVFLVFVLSQIKPLKKFTI